METNELWNDAMRADAEFSTELRRVYGKDSGDARYRYYTHSDTAVQSALIRKLHADEAWRNAILADNVKLKAEVGRLNALATAQSDSLCEFE